MAKICNIEKIMSCLNRWDPSDLSCIELLEIQYNSTTHQTDIKISSLFQERDLVQSWPNNMQSYDVVMLFFAICDLKIAPQHKFPMQIMGFTIDDISERGLENINFIVQDYEDNQLSFFCNQIEILSVTPR